MATNDNRRMVTAVFQDWHDGQHAYDELTARGYTDGEINVLMSDATRSRYEASQREPLLKKTHAVEGLAAGGVAGTVIGAMLAAVAAGTTIVFAGWPLVIAGPIIVALAGGGAGAVAGGLLGGLVGLGLPESDAKAYELALKKGGIVLGVAPHLGEDYVSIEDLFRHAGGDNISRC